MPLSPQVWVQRAGAAWDRWWFAPLDPRVPALLRAGYGLVGLWVYAPLWPELDTLLGAEGVWSLEAMRASNPNKLSVWALEPLAQGLGLRLSFGVFLASLVGLVLGLGSRVCMLLAWVGVVSLCNRAPVWVDGSDAVLRVLGLPLLLLPLGQTLSLDARLGWARPGAWPLWALRLFQLQVAVIYVKTGVAKALEAPWREGTAVWYAMASPNYWRFPMGEVLASPLFQDLTVLATWATLAFEIGFPLVFVARLRRAMLLAGLGLHLGIFVFMNLGGFSEVILWTYLAFLQLPPPRSSAR